MTRSSRLGEIAGTAVWILAILSGTAAVAPPARAQQTSPDIVVGNVTPVVRGALFDGLANQIGTLPNPTGGGFTYQFDPGLGIFTRSTESFGPIFTERAETTGRGKITLSTSYTRHTFDEVDGVKLRTGAITNLVAGISPDSVRLNLLEFSEDVEANVFTMGGLYGITDRLDVGVTIPIINVKVKERARRTFFLDCPPNLRADLSNCQLPGQLRDDRLRLAEADATGLGDIILRAKYNVWQWPNVGGGRIGVATSLDVKLPTGDEGDRNAFVNGQLEFDPPTSNRVVDSRFQIGDPPLGTGIVRVKPQVIVSGSWSGFAPHVNVGAELGETDGITNDLVYAVGFDWTVAGRATFVADLIGRHAFGVDRARVLKVGTGGPADADTLSASLGVKVNPVGTLLVFFNVLLPLNNTGVRDTVTPTFGVEWSF